MERRRARIRRFASDQNGGFFARTRRLVLSRIGVRFPGRFRDVTGSVLAERSDDLGRRTSDGHRFCLDGDTGDAGNHAARAGEITQLPGRAAGDLIETFLAHRIVGDGAEAVRADRLGSGRLRLCGEAPEHRRPGHPDDKLDRDSQADGVRIIVERGDLVLVYRSAFIPRRRGTELDRALPPGTATASAGHPDTVAGTGVDCAKPVLFVPPEGICPPRPSSNPRAQSRPTGGMSGRSWGTSVRDR
jgi:hypothetical protein